MHGNALKRNRGMIKKGQRISPETEFKKGHTPWNKGRKGVHYSPETEFKKGHVPSNTLYDGCVTIRVHKRTQTPYKYIRISLAKWELYHRYIWEQHYGPIPKNHVIRFKNGNTLDCRMENFELISRAENARRNHNPEKSSIGLKKAWKEGKFLTDKFVAATMTWGNKELKEDLLKNHPELIEIQRKNIKLRRSINEQRR